MFTPLFFCISFLFLFLLQHTFALTPILSNSCEAGSPVTSCINLGSNTATVGKYTSDIDLVKYRKKPSFVEYSDEVKNADEPLAYTNLVEKKTIKFYVEVPANSMFDVQIGIIDYQNCENEEGNQIKITVGGQKITVNPLLDQTDGCRSVITYSINNAKSNKKGRLSFRLKGKAIVSVGTICVTRHLMNPTSLCTDDNPLCETYDGCGNYEVIHASSAIPGTPCNVEVSSFASLSLPSDVFVRKAILQWAGSGYPNGDTTNVSLNGQSIVSTLLYKNRDFEPYYGAISESTDVTDIVRQIGYSNVDYVVSNIFHRKWHSCPQAHIAAWSLTVMYEKVGLPNARVNLCAKNTESTRKKYDFCIGCMVPWPTVPENAAAGITLVGIETDPFTERLAFNDKLVGFNEFNEKSGEGFDVLNYDLVPGNFIGNNNKMTVQFRNNTAHDVLTLAVMNTYQTL